MHGMCLSDAPMLRHAQQRNRVPSPPPHSQNAPNNRPGPRLFRLGNSLNLVFIQLLVWSYKIHLVVEGKHHLFKFLALTKINKLIINID